MSAWALPALFALALQVWLNLYALRRRPQQPLSPVLHGLLFSALLFTVGDLMGATLTESPRERWTGLFILYSGLIFLAPTWWLLALRFAEAEELGLPFTRKTWTYLPFGVAIALWFGLLTSPWHGQFLTPSADGVSVRHWMWWANATQSYLILVGVAGLYGFLVFRAKPGVLQTRLLILLLATLSTGSASALYVFSPWAIPFDPTSVGVGLSSMLFIIGIYRTRLFALSPFTLREVMNHQPGGVLVLGIEGQLLYANDRALEILGVSTLPASALVMPLLAQVLHPAETPDTDLASDDLERILLNPKDPEASHLFRHGHNDERWLRIFRAAIPNRGGKLRGWSLHLKDETRLQRAAQALRDTQIASFRSQKLESLDAMAGGIAHDFNNMLQGILGNTDMALEEHGHSNTTTELLREIESSALRARDLVEKLLLYTGNRPVEKAILQTSQFLDGAREVIEQTAGDQIVIDWRVEPSLPPIRAHEGQIVQALTSLVANASEAMGGGPGSIRIEATPMALESEQAQRLALHDPIHAGSYVCLRVLDSGPGIESELGERVFEPFFSTKFSGRGLGLAAVTGIVRTHGGSIGFENDPGHGAAFSIYLPVANAAKLSQHEATPVRTCPGRGDRILVVDDEASIRLICKRALGGAGLAVEEATSGREAVEIQRRHNFGLAIVDLTMPGIDGLETARRLREHDPGIHVILSSGFNEIADASGVDARLADAFLHKPYRPRELVELVQQVLDPDTAPPSRA